MEYFAASQDKWYYTSTSPLAYEIDLGDNPIYTGVAHKAPGETYTKINVGRRIYNWLQAHLDDFRTEALTTGNGQMASFTLRDSTGTELATYTALLNGAGAWNGESGYLSQPVNGHLDPRMKIFVTYATTSGGSIIIN